MFIILGGTGYVGSVVAQTLLDQHQPVTIVTRNTTKGENWKRRGAAVAITDIRNVNELRAIFRQGKRAFLLNPPADPSTDTDIVERETVHCILEALEHSGLEKVVAESTYGARPGEHCGDLSVLYELEEGLKAQSIPVTIQRGAYYMSNWISSLEIAHEKGVLPTMLPEDLKIPMVAPEDLGKAAARWLMEPLECTGFRFVEGPKQYSASDVADAFASVLSHQVVGESIPRNRWEEAFRNTGFSEPAAQSYARMTAVSVDGNLDIPDDPVRGSMTLTAYINALVWRYRHQ